MSNERLVLCGGASAPRANNLPSRLILDTGTRGITVKLGDIEGSLLAAIPPRLFDLLQIATYVYCADQAVKRGNDSDQHGDDWRRRFRFHIRVQDPGFWSSRAVANSLAETLGFLSDDDYSFEFEAGASSTGPGFLFGGDLPVSLGIEEVMLFSGGLDSLAGAVQEIKEQGKKVALVSHWANPKVVNRQKDLVSAFGAQYASSFLHVPVQIQSAKKLGLEYTQRSRSFLYASLATIVARLFKRDRIRFYENGVVSINLPISSELVGARATRTTHPRVLEGFSHIFSTVLEEDFAVENPFLWKTKTDVVRVIRDAGLANLIPRSHSCTRTGRQYRLVTPHCGECSQCVDRRFATLAAGCSDDEDPSDQYRNDVLYDPREPGTPRKMAVAYVEAARTFASSSPDEFFRRFPEVHRITGHIAGLDRRAAAEKILDLHRRHASEVLDLLKRETSRSAPALVEHRLPPDCLIVLVMPSPSTAVPPPNLVAPPPAEPIAKVPPSSGVPSPCLTLDDRDGEPNPTIWAHVVGHAQFDGLRVQVGPRELLFVFELFRSSKSLSPYGSPITIVEETDALRAFELWAKKKYLSPGKRKPIYRLRENWNQLCKKMEKTRLSGLFVKVQAPGRAGVEHYGLVLPPHAKSVRIIDIGTHLKTCRKRDPRGS